MEGTAGRAPVAITNRRAVSLLAADGDGVGIDEPGLAQVDINAPGPQRVGGLRLIDLLNHGADMGQHVFQVHRRVERDDAEPSGLTH